MQKSVTPMVYEAYSSAASTSDRGACAVLFPLSTEGIIAMAFITASQTYVAFIASRKSILSASVITAVCSVIIWESSP